MSPDQHRRELDRLKAEQARLERQRNDAQAASGKAKADAAMKTAKAIKASTSAATGFARQAASAEKKMNAEDKKAADLSKKIADNARKQTAAQRRLASALRTAQRKDDLETSRRRAAERAHARAAARAAAPTAVHAIRPVEPAQPEPLRVLYLTADPRRDLHVNVEAETVQQAVRRAPHGRHVTIAHRPAATPEDLLDGLNNVRPHVVHFAGHGRHGELVFDDADPRDPEPSDRRDGPEPDRPDLRGRPVDFALLARALAATSSPPKALILNACDTFDGADVLLDAVPVVIAMATTVSDLAATVFAAGFYSAVAAGQTVQAAFDQGGVAVDMAGLDEGWIPALLARDEADPAQMVLVQPPDE